MQKENNPERSVTLKSTAYLLEIIDDMNFPNDLVYTKNHVWVKLAEDAKGLCWVGITEVITRRFLLIERIDLPKKLIEISAGNLVATINGISDFDRTSVSCSIATPITGYICNVNPSLRKRFLKRTKPEVVKHQPYVNMLFGVAGNVEEQMKKLMSPAIYRAYLKEKAKKNPDFLFGFNNE